MAWAVANARVEPNGSAIIIRKQASGSAKIEWQRSMRLLWMVTKPHSSQPSIFGFRRRTRSAGYSERFAATNARPFPNHGSGANGCRHVDATVYRAARPRCAPGSVNILVSVGAQLMCMGESRRRRPEHCDNGRGNARVAPKGNTIVITKQASGSAKIDPLKVAFSAIALMSTNPWSSR
jgi:hypothetical protein